MARLTDKWAAHDLSPVKIWRLYLPQSINWLRLIAGTWLFVASSDNHVSKISCWDLSLVFQGYIEPLAEAYLPGQVKTGKLEVQASGIVLALGLGAESLSVHIITLRQHSGCHSFSELCRIEGSSHVLTLCGDLVACAVRHGAVVPHVVNWRNTRVQDIPPPPGGLDIPGRRSVPHLMTIWSGILVILRTDALEFYTLPSPTIDSIVFVKLIKIPTVWEAAVCDQSASVASADIQPLRLIVISSLGIGMCVIERELLEAWDEDRIFYQIPLAEYPPSGDDDPPWYRLCVGASGRRSLWVSAPVTDDTVTFGPHFVCMVIPPRLSGTEERLISWSNYDPVQPALWALPAVDFDDALGLTVMGNCFGEIAIYDHDGRYPERCGALGKDFTDQGSPIPPLLPAKPIFLGLSVVPRPPASSMQFEPAIVSQWSQDRLVLHGWSTDWTEYWNWDLWQGVPDDYVWVLQHAYGFPGPAIPQAYANTEFNTQYLLFRSGHRYFVFDPQSDPNLRSWPLTPPPQEFMVSDAQAESFVRRTAVTEGFLHMEMFFREVHKGRNRWVEQVERGGQPHPNLLRTKPW
ncbi:hypothetical protein B0H17DRAFT_1039655 [Mycena rosella]|uniref:Uncharacterized protein n=1 Tax=Mycena rosella TaxID=1033263 RepID=A0AAD7GSN5_MYCRO|nr:hypothetical protein B0H17DRAFT_1039655 [Mycena rosella]